MSDTEFRLAAWRDGSTQAERLSASLLAISGYENIDPQAPIGGPDSKKDIFCIKGGLSWVVAVFFASTPNRFHAIRRKFIHDLEGSVDNGKDGFVFVTNQSLTLGQREILSKLALEKGKELDLFHLERIRAALDSPSGYGVRVQFLRIPLTLEEQLAWFAESGTRLELAIGSNTRELRDLKSKIDRLGQGQELVSRTLRLVAGAVGTEVVTPLQTQDLLSSSKFASSAELDPISKHMSAALLRTFHRLTCFDLPTRIVGQFRIGRVWIGRGSDYVNESFEPPAPRDIGRLIDRLCVEWNAKFETLKPSTAERRLNSIAEFHARLLSIHPFEDGNGRVARAILMQQCLDLFGKADMSLMNKGGSYYTALQAADRGDFAGLKAIVAELVQ